MLFNDYARFLVQVVILPL